MFRGRLIRFSGRLFSFSAIVMSLFLLSYPLRSAPAQETASLSLQKVIEGARKEAVLKLQWFAGNLDDTGLRAIVAALNRRYKTELRLRFTPGPNLPTMLNKIAQEKSAGLVSSTDVNLMTSNATAEALKMGLFRKLDWNAILERPVPPDAGVNRVAPEGIGVTVGSAVVGITYNTNLVRGDDVPVSMEDVFKPKWAGKVAATPVATGLYHFAAKDMLGYDTMKNYTQRLANHIGGLISCTDVPRIGSGEFVMIVFDCGSYSTLNYKKRGAPVDSTPIREATRVNYFYMGVPAHAEHPRAATLFIAFLHTPEGQKILWDASGLDLHIYPESRSREAVLKVVRAGGKLMLDTVERDLKTGHEELNRIRDEFVKILKEGKR